MKVQLLVVVLIRASEERAKLSGCVLPPRRTAQLAHHHFKFGEVQNAVLIRIVLGEELFEVLQVGLAQLDQIVQPCGRLLF